jgi:hypothetical protein
MESDQRAVEACDTPVALAIEAQLGDGLRARRARFWAAFVAAAMVLGGGLWMMGPRPDLIALPAAGLVLAAVLVIAVLVLPAIGAGVFFPSRTTSLGLFGAALAGLGYVVIAGVDRGPWVGGPVAPFGPCATAGASVASVLLVAALFGRAFVERRARRAVVWTAAGVGISAATFVTSVCQSHDPAHLLLAHGVPALCAVAAAALIGLWAHSKLWRAVTT